MDININVNAAESVRRGITPSEVVHVDDAALAALGPEDRALLAARLVKDRAGYSLRSGMKGRTGALLSVPESTLAGVIEAARSDEQEAGRQAQEAAEHEAEVERIVATFDLAALADSVRDAAREQALTHSYNETPSLGRALRTCVSRDGDWDSLLAEGIYERLAHDSSLVNAWRAGWAGGETARAEREAEVKRKREAEKAALAAEVAAWIAAHGSERLRRLAEEDIEHQAVYRSERLALELPGWRFEADVPGGSREPRNAPSSALELLDAARATVPDAVLVYWVVEHACGEWCLGYEECPEYEWTGYAAVAVPAWAPGRRVVFGGPPADD